MTISTYRYVWKTVSRSEDHDTDLQFTFVTGNDEQHDTFISGLVDNPDVISAIREYVCSYDIDQIARVETIKKENENEKI